MKRTNTNRVTAFALAFVVAAGCAATLQQPTAKDADWATARWDATTIDDLRAGRDAYVEKCSGCHNLYLPQSHSPEAWETYVSKMGGRASLDARQRVIITRYLASASAVAHGTEPANQGGK